ncbi:methionine--tRNA ligase [Planobispora siamensis]|uniref:methionine--tRNA ligase n=1 Tax=Planobispora siamensis TaxID=936338 RepID=A0A8J3SGN4_9ACTN|nr:methionine--tRNA ligase [Planobispora siamensis]GIH92226.1 methionine--tRNA ligase [Planobispora siamensis]
MTRLLLSTTIPYVNGRPHLGFALELVQADVLARHHRLRGDEVRLQTGTDDNSLKNVQAADAAGVAVGDLVDRNAAEFARLAGPLSLRFDDFLRTSADPRHRAGVERFWRACAHDLYRKHYEGLYCVGCEHFYQPGERCPEHEAPLQRVSEENWFFRLSRHQERLYDLIAGGRIRIEPAERRNEVLAFVAGGLTDFSVSRSRARARGWGIPVPGDPDQVIYVWWDALGYYLTALEYGTGGHDRWWGRADRRVHLLGKSVLRFHAVYWPAMLLSAREALPTDILVHDHLTVNGRKISKSGGPAVDPLGLVAEYGVDAVRWWLLRDVPRVGDADFTVERLIARHDDELANGLGNLVSRVAGLVHRYRDGVVPAVRASEPDSDRVSEPDSDRASELEEVRRRAPGAVAEALDAFDFRRATGAVYEVVEAANRYVSRTRPWQLAREDSARLDPVLGTLVETCREVAGLLTPFLPDAAARIAARCAGPGERLPAPAPVFPRLGGAA